MKKILFFFSVFIALIGATSAMAASIVLSDYEFYVDGDTYYLSFGDTVPGLDAGAFDWATGIGTLSLTFNPGTDGSYAVDAWFDHDIYNNDDDGVYEDESALLSGSPGDNGQFGVAGSDLYVGADMWMGYNAIALAADQYAVITFTISQTAPTGFFVHQIQEAYSNASGFIQDRADLYLSSNIDIRTNPVPEPAMMLLFITGFAGLVGSRYARRKKEK